MDHRGEGIHRMEMLGDQHANFHALKVSQATSLRDLEEEYALFTHAPLFTHGKWNKDPVTEYIVNHPGVEVHRIFTKLPLFKGLAYRRPDGSLIPDWNHIMMCCHKEHWTGLRDFLMRAGGVDRRHNIFQRMLVQVLPVIDMLAMERSTHIPQPLPMVSVMTFGLDGSDRIVCFEPALDPLTDKVKIKIMPPEPETVKLGMAMIARSQYPYRSLDPPLPEQLSAMKKQQKASVKDLLRDLRINEDTHENRSDLSPPG